MFLENRKKVWFVLAIVVLLVIAAIAGWALFSGKTAVIVISDPNATSSGGVTATASSTATPSSSIAIITPSSTFPSTTIPTFPPILESASTTIDTSTYNMKMLALANLPIVTRTFRVSSTLPGSSTVVFHTISATTTAVTGWPVTTAPYPLGGALLPYNRIVAYYGNLYSPAMGVLGEYPAPQMLAMLASTSAQWAAADPSTPVIPALDYIVVAAQASPGPDGKYRLRMPDSQVQQILSMANEIHGLVFLDVQVGLSNVETEVPLLEQYLKLPNVELSLDPEFDMHDGAAPGTVIGTMDASDINFAAQYLAQIVHDNNLPPKILVIHRFTDDMVTHTSEIQPLPEVQIVMDMDGFGFPAKKINTYEQVIAPYPVQFTGFKLFYKNDTKGPDGALMTPAQVLQLSPEPSYIQYQ